jgi:hypothetical protein
MQEYSDALIYAVVVVAFIAGYALVSFIARHLKDLRSRPSLNEQIWREQARAEEERRRPS